MNILIISDCFYPETKSISRHIYDLIKKMDSKKIKVSFYFISNKKNKKFFNDNYRLKNVNYNPVFLDNLKKKKFVFRGIHEFKSPYLIWKKIKHSDIKFDKILVFSPSIFFGLIFRNLKVKFNCKIILIIRDIFPNWVMQKNIFLWLNPFYLFALIISKLQFYFCDVIATQSKNDFKIFKKKYPNKKVMTLYNWITPKKIKIKIKKNKITKFIFGGTIGPAQNWDNIIRLIVELKKNKALFKFHFIGDGKNLNYLKEKIQILNENVLFIKPKPEEEYIKFLTKMDIGVISLDQTILFNNIPGKFFSYLETNLFILSDTAYGQDISKIINNYKVGLTNNKSNTNLLSNAIKLSKQKINYRILRKKYNRLLKEKFSTEIAYKKLIKA